MREYNEPKQAALYIPYDRQNPIVLRQGPMEIDIEGSSTTTPAEQPLSLRMPVASAPTLQQQTRLTQSIAVSSTPEELARQQHRSDIKRQQDAYYAANRAEADRLRAADEVRFELER